MRDGSGDALGDVPGAGLVGFAYSVDEHSQADSEDDYQDQLGDHQGDHGAVAVAGGLAVFHGEAGVQEQHATARPLDQR